MTAPFRNILVDIDADAADQPAIELATRLARHNGGMVRVTDTWAGRRRRPPEELLLEEVERGGYDLIVRAQARDLVGGEAVNAYLFRHCPCPVWAVGTRPLPRRPRILAAVNPGVGDPEAAALDKASLEFALWLAESESGSLTVLHAWRAFAEKQIAVHATAAEFETALETTSQRAGENLGRLVHSFGGRLSRARVEMWKGAPEVVVPEFAVANGIDLVVAGARGNGVWRRLFGNTAVRVLERAPCSVVAVKKRKDACVGFT